MSPTLVRTLCGQIHGKLFSHTSDLYPLCACGTPLPSCDNLNVSRYCQMSPWREATFTGLIWLHNQQQLLPDPFSLGPLPGSHLGITCTPPDIHRYQSWASDGLILWPTMCLPSPSASISPANRGLIFAMLVAPGSIQGLAILPDKIDKGWLSN